MSVTTNGQICFGIPFGERDDFPWQDDEWEGDIDEWWMRSVCGWKPSKELYAPDGDYIDGRVPSDQEIDDHYREQREFAKRNPLPVQMVNTCSGDYPMWIIAVADVGISASRGYPAMFDPAGLSVTDDQVEALAGFCKRFGLVGEGDPGWYLSSYWG